MMRINRYIAQSGAASRRQADALIKEGSVSVLLGGVMQTAEEGMQIGPDDRVFIRGVEVIPRKKKTYVIYHKPRGVTCTLQKKDRRSLANVKGLPAGLTYAGRLDADSTGLVLLTDDGDLIENISRGAHRKEKEYLCTVDHPVTPEFLEAFRSGVRILDTVTRPCVAEALSDTLVRIVLTQGLNRQIRRMCKALGYKVVSLCRIRIANLTLNGLSEGKWRYLTDEEEKELLRIAGMGPCEREKGEENEET